jgi:hypothetical protein
MALLRATAMAAMAASGLLAGCGVGGPSVGLFPKFGLYFNQDDQTASLAYGRPNSDDVGLMLQCAKGSRMVELTDVASAGPADRLILVSGPDRTELPVKVRADETGASLAMVRLPSDAPVLQGFRRSGVVEVRLGGASYGLKARPDERSAVANFFTACERR